METGETTTACLLTADSLTVILKKLEGHDIPKFAYALLHAATNAENWYFVEGNLNSSGDIIYEQQIMPMYTLDELFEVTWAHDHSTWFRVTRR